MPTTRPRHSITETPPVKEALEALRAAQGSIDFSELTDSNATATPHAMRASGSRR